MKNYRILHIITSLSTGGAETALRQLVLNDVTKHHTHAVVSLGSLGEIGRQLRSNGIEVYPLKMGSRFPRSIISLWSLSRIIRDFKPDIIQTWMYHANLIGGLVAHFSSDAPVVWTLRQDIFDRTWIKATTNLIINLTGPVSRFVPHTILSVSQRAIDTHVKLGYPREKMRHIPNGFNLDKFKPDAQTRRAARQQIGLSDDVKVIGYFARYHPMKNHRLFLEAAAQLHADHPDVHYVLAGKDVDADNQQLVEDVKRGQLEDVVHLLGFRTDIQELYPALDIYSISSLSEGFPMAVGEAMASGIPCVVTDAGDAPILVGDTGLVVPTMDADALAEAWRTLLEASPEKMQALHQASRARVNSNYRIDQIAEKYESLYQELMSSQASQPQ